ncbi:MAG: HDOD domain-containing protein [Rhodocyclales bacterium]|nr:HDOD domain-containing protein [Rhodocyclales bacterium]
MKHLLGGAEPATFNDDPFGSRPPSPTAKMPIDAPAVRSAIVHRDELIDGRSRIAGYRFVVRRLGSELPPDPAETVGALRAENLVAFAGRRLALLPITAGDWQRADFRQLVAANTTFLVATPAAGEDGDGWLATLREIREAGGRVALNDAGAAVPAAVALADLVLLDFRAYALERFEQLARSLRRRHPDLALAADGIGNWAEHRLCLSLGLTYSLGGFAVTADDADQTEKLNQSRLVLIEMLNLLRGDAELDEISAVAKRDPGIAVKLIGMANSPVSGLASPVASLEQATMVLGRATIYRWLSIAMFRSGNGGGRDEALLELALWRARFLELAAQDRRPKQECDELFLVGLLSLLDSLLGLPMAQLVRRMNLPAQVVEVLLNSDGPYGRFLLLALAVEKGRGEQVQKLADSLDIAEDRIDAAAREARQWAEAALSAG